MSGKRSATAEQRRWALLLTVVVVTVLLSVGLRASLDLEWSVVSLRELVDRSGVWGPILYVAILTFRFAVLVPSSILLSAAGLCFGALPGTAYASLGLTLSALLKFAAAAYAGRDVVLRELPERWQARASSGGHGSTASALSLICAYPFGPKHIFQFAAILSGMSLGKYALAVGAGATVRAAAFSGFGDSLATGQGWVVASVTLFLMSATPLFIPRCRAWLFAKEVSA